MKKFILAAALAFLPVAAFAQAVQQSGSVTPNTIPAWNSNGVIKGGVTAVDSPVTNFGVTRDGADGICVASARQSAAGRNTLCLQASTSAAAKIVLQNYGTATAQDLQFVINGNTLTLPTGATSFVVSSGVLVSGNFPKWSGTAGLVIDSGMTAATGSQYGAAVYTAAGAIGSTAAMTNGQMVVGTTGGNPAARTMSGDVGSISAAGAVTLQSVNGVTYPSTFTANGILYANTATAVTNVGTSNIGYCLLSQGSSSAPIWASCASGSGSAGGSDTQVQFNNATSLAGSANLTWVSPALRLGVSGTTTGQLQLNSSAGASGAVTVQAPTATAAYNFNLPTGAGSSGQPLLSGGGGATAMTFGTLAVGGGGTGGTVASGTLLDNISGFASTGYINRTGSGTYAFSANIPVSQGGTGLASGTSGGVLCFTASGTIASSSALTANTVVIGGGAGVCPSTISAGTNGQVLVGATGAAPAFQTLSGDITTVTSGGAVTIANSAISNAKLANSAAYTLKGNFTGSSAAPQDSTIGTLTQKASPAAGDYLILQDNAAAGQLKYATVASVASAGSVSSIAGNTGAFTLKQPINNATNEILLNATISPQGRITLTTATPVMTATTVNQTTVYYTPYRGNLVPIYDGTNIIPTAFAEVSQATTDATKSPAAAANNSNYDVFCWIDSGTNRCTRGPPWTSDTGRGTGAGTTELVRVSGLWLNAVNITNGPSAQRGTYVGTIRTDGSAQVDYDFGAVAANWTPASFGVWNAYNRVRVLTFIGDTTDSWTYNVATTWRAPNGNTTTARISAVRGLNEDGVEATYFAVGGAGAATNMASGIGLNSTTAMAAGSNAPFNSVPSTSGFGSMPASYNGLMGLGFNFLSAIEINSSTTASTWLGDAAVAYTQTGMRAIMWQ